MARKRRSDHLREEAAFLPTSVDDLVELRRRLIDSGHPDQVASAIVGWLVAKTTDDPDLTASSTRSRYRKILASIEPLHDPTPTDDEEGRRLEVVGSRNRRQRGQGVRKALVALAVVGTGVTGAGSHQHAAEAMSARRTRPAVEEPAQLDGTRRRRRTRSRWGRAA